MTPEARRQYIAGNWKMHKTTAQAREYVQRLLSRLPMGNGVELALCVPYTALAATVDALGGSEVKVLAQNMHQLPEGAFTGEVSAPMIAELGVNGVLLGHSERRQHYNETDRALQEKVPAALEAGLQPMLCVGETEEEHEAGDTQRKLRHQVQEALEKVPDERLRDVVIAYEPIWAIGTGKVATPEHAQEAIGFIRALVGDRSEDAAQRVRVLYGGSVKPENAGELLGQPDIDGALVGGASLDPDGLVEIVKAAAAAQ
jgi:triosephosphate isomerase